MLVLQLWTVVTLLVNFPDVSDTVEWESTDLHAYLVTDLIFLFAYLILVRAFRCSRALYKLYYRQPVMTIRTRLSWRRTHPEPCMGRVSD